MLVLVVSPEQGLATQTEAILRNRGWQARAAWAADIGEAEEALARTEPELVVADSDIPLAEICDLAKQLSPELQVLRIGRSEADFAASGRAASLADGAADVVGVDSEDAEAHFAAVCQREFNSSRRSWALREARMRLAEYESRQRALVAETTRAILTVSEGIIVEANPAAAELLGFSEVDELVAQPFLDLVAEPCQADVREHLTQLTKRRITDTEFTADFLADQASPLICRISARYSEDDNELQLDAVLRPAGATPAASQDTTAGAAAHTFAEIREALRTALSTAASEEAHHGLLYCRLDGFPEHEKRMGLATAAQIADTWDALIAEALPSQALAFRMNPEEVAVVCPGESTEALEELAESLRLQVAQQNFRAGDFECHISCSIAVYPVGAGSPEADRILSQSFQEVRRISAERGNTVCSIGDAARAAAEERKAKEFAEEIRSALSDNRFQLAYQNIACLGEDTRQLFDVLVRMRDTRGNELQAREFLPTAERFALMQQIDEWVLARAIQTVTRRPGTGLFVRMAEASLQNPEALIKLIEAHRPAAGSIGIQLRESVLQHHVKKAAALREKLRGLQIEFVIDHFGDDPASASALEEIQPDYVKFGPDFTARIEEQAIHDRLEQLVRAAHKQDCRVIVPFVENTRVMGSLWQMGINYVQGNGVQEAEAVMLSGERIQR